MTQESGSTKNTIQLFTHQVSSTKPVDGIVANMGEACDKFKFSVLYSYNYFEILKTKGFPIERKAHVFEICQAKMASKMLTSNPEFSIFMPCRIAVYETEGKTIIATMNMELLLAAVKHNKELYEEATAMFQSLKELMNSLA